MADRPPGPDTRDGPAAQPARPHHARAPLQGPPATVDDGADSGPDLAARVAELAAASGIWSARDDTRPEPEVRQAVNRAIDLIDSMLRELHAMRSRFISQIRVSDDLAAERADELLARLREERSP
jgi:hypothetical protein